MQKRDSQLGENNQDFEVFNSILRHDISNYLTVINNYLELIETDSCRQDYIDKIRDATNKSLDLIGKIRVVRDHKESEETIKPVNLSNMLLEELNEVSKAMTQSYIPDSVYVMANEMLSTVFSNLVQNAILHNDKNQKEIYVSVNPKKDWVEVRIADNGPGIENGMKNEVFREGVKGESGRTGLGLYIVNMLIENYGGKVWIEDNVPEGTVFVIKLRSGDMDENGRVPSE